MKMIIIESFQWLVQHELVNIYGYVVMDNHIHVLWEQLKMNGKESPKESFEKYTFAVVGVQKGFVSEVHQQQDYATQWVSIPNPIAIGLSSPVS
jgi:REP element-mobilizing transposase RayT